MLRAYDEEDDDFDDRSVEEYGFEEPEGDFDTCGAGVSGVTLPSWMGESSLPASAESAHIDSLDDSCSPRRSKYRRYGTGLGESGGSGADRPNAGVCRRFGPYSVACLAILALVLGLSVSLTGKEPKELVEEAEEWIEVEWEIEFGHGHDQQQDDAGAGDDLAGDGKTYPTGVDGGETTAPEWDETEQEMFGEHGDEGAEDAGYDGKNYGWNENENGVVSLATPAGDWDNGPALIEYPDAAHLAFRGADFEDGDALPESYRGNDGTSPPLEWGDVPSGVKSFAVLLDEPLVGPAQGGKDSSDGDEAVPAAPTQSGDDNMPGVPHVLSHWVAYDIPPGAIALPGGLPNSERIPADSFGGGDGWSDMYMFQGPNSWGSAGDFYQQGEGEGTDNGDAGDAEPSEATIEAQERYKGVGVGYHGPNLSSTVGDSTSRICYFRLFALAGILTGGQEGLDPQDATRSEVLRRVEGVGVLGTASIKVLI